MLEDLIVQDYVVLPAKRLVSEARAISPNTYVVIVDRNEAPVAVATKRDVASLTQPDEVQLVEVVSHLPHALIAGRGIAIERLAKVATASPEIFGRGTILLRGREVAGVFPVRNMVTYLRTQGAGFTPTIARLNAASGLIGSSIRNIEALGKIGSSIRVGDTEGIVGEPDCLWVICADCGWVNCLESIPDEDEDMPLCQNPDLPAHLVGKG